MSDASPLLGDSAGYPWPRIFSETASPEDGLEGAYSLKAINESNQLLITYSRSIFFYDAESTLRAVSGKKRGFQGIFYFCMDSQHSTISDNLDASLWKVSPPMHLVASSTFFSPPALGFHMIHFAHAVQDCVHES